MIVDDLKDPHDLLLYIYRKPFDFDEKIDFQSFNYLIDIQTNQAKFNLLKQGGTHLLVRNPHAILYPVRDEKGNPLYYKDGKTPLVSSAIPFSPQEVKTILQNITSSAVLFGFSEDTEKKRPDLMIVNVFAYLKPYQINGVNGYTLDLEKDIRIGKMKMDQGVPLAQNSNTFAAQQRYNKLHHLEIHQYPPQIPYHFVGAENKNLFDLFRSINEKILIASSKPEDTATENLCEQISKEINRMNKNDSLMPNDEYIDDSELDSYEEPDANKGDF